MARKSKHINMKSIEEVADIETPQEEEVVVEDTTVENQEPVEEVKQEVPLKDLIGEEKPHEVLSFDNLESYNDKALRDKMLDLLDVTNEVSFLIDDSNEPYRYYITKDNSRVYFYSKGANVTSLKEVRNLILDNLAKVGHSDQILAIAVDTDLSYRYYEDESLKPVLTISRTINLVDKDNKQASIVSQYIIEAERDVIDMFKALCRELSQRSLNKDVVSVEYTKDLGVASIRDKYIGINEVIHTLDDMYRG